MLCFEHIHVHLFELFDLRGLKFVKISSHTGIEDASLLFNSHWYILLLLEQFSKLLSSVEQLLGSGVKIGTELGEGSDLTILSQLKLERTCKHLHGLNLGCRSDS